MADLILKYPQGFEEMTKEELRHYAAGKDVPEKGAQDKDRHILLTVTKKRFNPLVTFLADPRNAVATMEGTVSSLLKDHQYEYIDLIEFDVAGEKGSGFLYAYVNKDTPMEGVSMIVKKEKAFYYIRAYFKREIQEEILPMIEEILKEGYWQ